METLKVQKEMRLDALILKEYPFLKLGILHKYLRQNKIKVNGKKIPLNSKLQKGDEIQLYINNLNKENSIISKPSIIVNLEVIYEDDNILIANKPAGIISIDEKNNKADSFFKSVIYYLNQADTAQNSNAEFKPRLCHRLDTGTSGLLITAKNQDAYDCITQAMKDGKIEKNYLCVVYGIPKQKAAKIKAYLIKNSTAGTVKIFDNEVKNSKEIVTEYKTLFKGEKLSLLNVKLVTGRTHQIRAHLAHIGLPIIGDSKYGVLEQNRKYKAKYQMLCAHSLIFKNLSDVCCNLNGKEFCAKKPWYATQITQGKL